MANDASTYTQARARGASRLFYHKLHGLAPLGLGECKRYIEALDGELGGAGVPALLTAYGANYLASDTDEAALSEERLQRAQKLLEQHEPLRSAVEYYARTMRLLYGTFTYCLREQDRDREVDDHSAYAFEAMEHTFSDGLMPLRKDISRRKASALFGEVLNIAQDAIEQARTPLGFIQAQALAHRPHWVQRTAGHEVAERRAMADYFSRLFNVAAFRRPVEGLLEAFEGEACVKELDPRLRSNLKPLVVAAYPYAEALFYPSCTVNGVLRKHSPVEPGEREAREAKMIPDSMPYTAKEEDRFHTMHGPELYSNARAQQAQSVARMVGVAEAIFDAVAAGKLSVRMERGGYSQAQKQIAQDVIEAGLAATPKAAMDFVRTAAGIARAELKQEGRGSASGR